MQNQLINYKEIISTRPTSTQPVITYQDNMQMSRTSLRHLRLSKLQKAKTKQEKMWEFTVQRWRVADVSAIESNFDDEALSMKPQRDLKDLIYEETKIGNV